MPGPSLPNGFSFNLPPETIKLVSEELYDYLYMLHINTFGADGTGGALDDSNVSAVSHSKTTASSYDHHGAGTHNVVQQATASADVAASGISVDTANAGTIAASSATVSTVSVTTADADATYDTAERDLVNELKADVNTLVTDVNTTAALANELKTDYDAAVSLINELKADVNTLVTDVNIIQAGQNELKTNMRASGLLAP